MRAVCHNKIGSPAAALFPFSVICHGEIEDVP
jgi:hypothetical protein